MTKTVKEIAEEALPGWKVVRGADRSPKQPRPRAQYGTPDLADLRKRYLGDDVSAGGGFVPASALTQDDTEFVEMEPSSPNASGHRRVVIISQGKAVAVQG